MSNQKKKKKKQNESLSKNESNLLEKKKRILEKRLGAFAIGTRDKSNGLVLF